MATRDEVREAVYTGGVPLIVDGLSSGDALLVQVVLELRALREAVLSAKPAIDASVAKPAIDASSPKGKRK